jgi:YegS/Rv2252/BmrU family lipid kinase
LKNLFIINKKAGKGQYKKIINILNELQNKYEIYIEIIKKGTDLNSLIEKILEFNELRIYIVGGDGTVNVIVNKILDYNLPFGIVPCGTGNDLASFLYGKRNWDIKTYILKLLDGKEDYIDIGRVDDKYFLNIASVGFDADVAKEANKLKRISFFPRFLAYNFSIIKVLIRKKSKEYKIYIDDNNYSNNYLLIAIANGKYYGGGIIPAPNAKINDGLFDVCLVKDVSIFKFLKLLPLYKPGKHTNLDMVNIIKCKKISIVQEKEEPLNLDGDIFYKKSVNFEILHKKIKFIYPKG